MLTIGYSKPTLVPGIVRCRNCFSSSIFFLEETLFLVMESFQVPSSVEFQAALEDEKTTTESLDELSALNTALCFLCSINADFEALETFLTLHPQSLLLDGTGVLPEESALYIVESQRNSCECISPDCRQNRRQVWTVLGRGFEHYQRRHYTCKHKLQNPFSWDFYSQKLQSLEGDIRGWRTEEQNLRNRVLEATVELKTLETRLSQERKVSLLCSREIHQRRSILEYQIGVGHVNTQSVTREHQTLVRRISQARKRQFSLLQRVFSGVGRHPCTI